MAAALSVPKKIVIAPPGTPYFKDHVDVGDPGIEKELLTDSVPAGTVRNLQQVVVVCRMEGNFQILAAGQVVGSGRTGAATPNVPFGFAPWRPFPPNTEIKILFTQRSGCPPAPVEVYIQASDIGS